MHNAKLVWVTPNAEALIGKIARVSNPNNEDNPEVEKLIKYLIKHKHWSPMEMVSMCVEIVTTRAISPQILRHRSFSFQEFSQRYSVSTEAIAPDLRRQDLTNRQNSIPDLETEVQACYKERIEEHFDQSFALYESLLHSGIAKECARSVLPLNTVTRLYMSGTLRSWLHYVDLRAQDDTQLEHRTIARSIGEILASEFPTVSRAMWN